MSTEIIEQSGFYRLWTEQGREQGVEEGFAAALLAALRGRFGALTPDVEAAATSASRETTLRLLSAITTISLEDVRAELGLPRA